MRILETVTQTASLTGNFVSNFFRYIVSIGTGAIAYASSILFGEQDSAPSTDITEREVSSSSSDSEPAAVDSSDNESDSHEIQKFEHISGSPSGSSDSIAEDFNADFSPEAPETANSDSDESYPPGTLSGH